MRRLLMVLILAAVSVGAALFIGLRQPEPAKSVPAPLSHAAKPSPVAIPHREEIMAQAQRPPTDQEQAEEARLDGEQVLDAVERLKSKDVQARVDGIEQLGAYPTRESEQQLAVSLRGDPSVEVRIAAADALSEFERLAEHSMAALLEALEDRSEAVQASALNALESHVDRTVTGSKQRHKLLGALKARGSAHGLAKTTRRSIQEFLEDQAEGD